MAPSVSGTSDHRVVLMRHYERTVYKDGSGWQDFYVVVGPKGAVVVSFNVSSKTDRASNATLSWHSPRPTSSDIEGEPCGWIEAPGWCTATGLFDEQTAKEHYHGNDQPAIYKWLEKEYAEWQR